MLDRCIRGWIEGDLGGTWEGTASLRCLENGSVLATLFFCIVICGYPYCTYERDAHDIIYRNQNDSDKRDRSLLNCLSATPLSLPPWMQACEHFVLHTMSRLGQTLTSAANISLTMKIPTLGHALLFTPCSKKSTAPRSNKVSMSHLPGHLNE